MAMESLASTPFVAVQAPPGSGKAHTMIETIVRAVSGRRCLVTCVQKTTVEDVALKLLNRIKDVGTLETHNTSKGCPVFVVTCDSLPRVQPGFDFLFVEEAGQPLKKP